MHVYDEAAVLSTFNSALADQVTDVLWEPGELDAEALAFAHRGGRQGHCTARALGLIVKDEVAIVRESTLAVEPEAAHVDLNAVGRRGAHANAYGLPPGHAG